MEIKGAASWQANGIFSGSWGNATADNDVSGALTLTKTTKYGGIGVSGEDSAKNGIQINFQASKNWTGSTSGGTAHSHSFSNAATIGSGDYTRPSSVTAVMLIKY